MSIQTAIVRAAGVFTALAVTNFLGVGAGIDTAGATSLGLGTANASAIAVGRSGITTTITGGLTQLTGAVSITGNAASSLTTSSGGLTLTGAAASTWSTAAGALTLTSAAAATWSTGAGALTVNGASALNLQAAGVTALAITSSGTAITVQAGATLATTGSGNINLPNNGSARFQIEGVAVSANVTAANLATLTGGGDASALHSHASGAISGLTTTGVTTGLFGYVSSANTLGLAQSDSTAAKALVLGVNVGTSGSVQSGGAATVAFTTAGGTPTVGSPYYLAALTDDTNTGAGKGTATEPTTGYSVALGIVIDASGYAGAKTCLCSIRPEPRVLVG